MLRDLSVRLKARVDDLIEAEVVDTGRSYWQAPKPALPRNGSALATRKVNLCADPAHGAVRAKLFEGLARLMMAQADRSPFPTASA